MESKKKFSIPGWQWILVALVSFVAVLTLQQYILFEIEQTRVFVYEGDKIAEQLMRAGGIADFIALFLQQFFVFKVAAAAIMAIILTLVSFTLRTVYKHAAGRKPTLAEDFFCCIPAAFLFVYTEGKIFFITGHVAILLSSLGLLAGVLVANRKNIVVQALLPLIILFVGFASSTAVWPMIAALTLYTLLYRKNYIATGITLVSAGLMVALARYTCLALTDVELYSPDYFSYRTSTPTTMSWVWAAIVMTVIAPLAVKKFINEKILKHFIFAGMVAAAVIGLTYKVYQSYHDEETLQRLALQYWVDNGEYQEALEFTSVYFDNIYMSNIYFMLASQNTELEEYVGGVLKDGRQLIIPDNSLRIVRRHLMTLYYYLGYTNGAHREAFEYNEPTDGMMVPSAVKILVLTNLIQGNYALAEKYLNHLDHTLFYSSWAQQYRPFLYNDKAVENDPELGPRRKALAMESVPQTCTTLPHIIRQIAYLAPELPATNYKKAFLRLGDYTYTRNENVKQSYIQY